MTNEYEYLSLPEPTPRKYVAPALLAVQGAEDGRAFRASGNYATDEIRAFLRAKAHSNCVYTKGFCKGLRDA